MSFTHGSLFSGIGGFDLAAQWMGWENLFHCEWNPFGQRVLKHYWPDAESFKDITKTDFTKYANRIDVISGGFPCQPYSAAGKRLGKTDSRHLWPEMLRAIREVKPRYVVGENVPGLVNWSAGLVFHEVQTDLENEGYETIPAILPAGGINAPHRRDRIWFIAHAKNNGPRGRLGIRENSRFEKRNLYQCEENGREKIWSQPERYNGIDTNTDHQGLQRSQFTGTPDPEGQKRREQPPGSTAEFCKIKNWIDWPTEYPVCGGNDGIPAGLAGITVSNHRKETLKGYGNAIVPQVVYRIFKAIEDYENLVND